MRVRLDDGKTVVTLKHFRYTSAHIDLLRTIQRETENLELLAIGPDNRPRVIPAFKLNLDYEEIRFLNPNQTC